MIKYNQVQNKKGTNNTYSSLLSANLIIEWVLPKNRFLQDIQLIILLTLFFF